MISDQYLLDDDSLRYDDVAGELIAEFNESCDDEAAPRDPVLKVGDGFPFLKRGTEQVAHVFGVERGEGRPSLEELLGDGGLSGSKGSIDPDDHSHRLAWRKRPC